LAEYESDTASQTSTESSYSDLEAKIREKETQLNNVRDGSRRSTAPLRKEIELLKKLLQAENKVKELERKEREWQEQIRNKEREIEEKQEQINRLKESEKNQSKKIERLEKRVGDLTAEKNALQEKMLAERQEALKE
jgi:chromosome segregation ATPase